MPLDPKHNGPKRGTKRRGPKHRDPKHNDQSLDAIIDPLVSRVYSPNGQYAGLVKLRMADNRVVDVATRQLISGASLEAVVRTAAKAAFARELLTGKGGIAQEDLTGALARELHTTAGLLTAQNVKTYFTSISEHEQPVEVIVNRRSAASV